MTNVKHESLLKEGTEVYNSRGRLAYESWVRKRTPLLNFPENQLIKDLTALLDEKGSGVNAELRFSCSFDKVKHLLEKYSD